MPAVPDLGLMIRRKPTEMPALHLAHPLSSGLRFCTPFWEGFNHNREVIDLVGIVPDFSWPATAEPGAGWGEDVRGPHWRENTGFGGIDQHLQTVFTATAGRLMTFVDDWTILWAGQIEASLPNDTFLELSSGRDFIRFFHRSALWAFEIQPRTGGQRSTSWTAAPAKDLVLVVRNDNVGGLEAWLNGAPGTGNPDSTALGIPSSEPIRLTCSGHYTTAGTVDFPDAARHHLVAIWDYAIAESWIPLLTEDPWLMMRTPEDPEQPYYPIWKRLPCFDLGNRRVVLKPIDQTEVRDGQIQAASAARIRRERREIDLDLTLLSENEKTALLACWDNGAGLVRSFWMQLAGETEARRYVFKTPLFSIEHRGPGAKIAKASFIDVTRFE